MHTDGANMFFSIQVSSPRFVEDLVSDAETLTELLEDLFLLDSEDAYLNWNGSRVALSYKYDISTILPDLVGMLSQLLEQPQGNSVVEWPSNTFRATWRLSWSEGILKISTDWISIIGNIESALQAVALLELRVDAFLEEWAELVRFLAGHLDRLAPPPQLEGLAEFQKVAKAVSAMQRGVLYRPEEEPVVV